MEMRAKKLRHDLDLKLFIYVLYIFFLRTMD